MPILLVWALALALPVALLAGLVWFLLRPLFRWLGALITSLRAWRLDGMGQLTMCESCSTMIAPGRHPIMYGRCTRCRTAPSRLRVA